MVPKNKRLQVAPLIFLAQLLRFHPLRRNPILRKIRRRTKKNP